MDERYEPIFKRLNCDFSFLKKKKSETHGIHKPCKKTKEIAFKQELDIDITFSLGNNFTNQLVIKGTSLNTCTKCLK